MGNYHVTGLRVEGLGFAVFKLFDHLSQVSTCYTAGASQTCLVPSFVYTGSFEEGAAPLPEGSRISVTVATSKTTMHIAQLGTASGTLLTDHQSSSTPF